MREPAEEKHTRVQGQTELKTSIHLMMVVVVTIFSIMEIVVINLLSWEMWMIPLVIIAIIAIWTFHIVGSISEESFEFMCIGIILVLLFFYGIHDVSLFDLPVPIGVLLLIISMLNKKQLLYMLASTYAVIFFYHAFFLHTIHLGMEPVDYARIALDIVGIVSEIVVILKWMDKRNDQEIQIRDMVVRLSDARQQNADFLSNISHELRTPINVVTGISGVVLGQELDHEIRENMNSIQMAGMRLSGQIKDILDYTEIVGKNLVVTKEPYMISSVIGDIAAAITAQEGMDRLEIVFDMDVDIPSVMIGDEEKIGRIIKILLDNAVKFTREGGVYVHVGFRREIYGLNLNIDICDTGIGMTSAQLARIYDDFYQADSSRSRTAGGLGLGLSIAHGLLQSMGGFINIESEDGVGTQVHISIPQSIVDDTPSITVEDPGQFCIACYLMGEKYGNKEVREFYNNTIFHMAVGLGLEAHKANTFEDVEKLRKNHTLTHLFTGRTEYEQNRLYFEEMGKSICVIVIADGDFSLPADSSLIFLRKPLNALPIANLLNGKTYGTGALGEIQIHRKFTCSGVHALVVDDEEMNLVVAKGILSGYGMEVDTCNSGEEAIEKCTNTVYDIVFLDHMMPVLDGIETLKRIRMIKSGVYQQLPIIALTANAVSGAREMFKGEGFTEFIPKPIVRFVLERVLRQVLPEQVIRYDEVDTGTSVKPQTEEKREETLKQQEEPVQMEKEAPTLLESLKNGGIDVEAGLNYCSRSEDFYLEMLKMFYTQSNDKKKEILRMYDEANWNEYAIKVHALKSTSQMIGALQLSRQAKELEQAGKNGDENYIRENHHSLLRIYESMLDLIAAGLGLGDGQKGGEEL